MTKKTVKKTAAETKPKAGVEIGKSGTNVFSGIINEEYLSELSGTRAMTVYDEMRKSDATVKAALLAVGLPIRRAQWFVQAASEDPRDEEIRDFVSSALFEYQSITWDDFLRQALLMTAYGVMVFEKVFEVKEVEGKSWVCWKKFAPRLPKSIVRWSIANDQDGITQNTVNGAEAQIPMEKLLVFVQEKEGDNWWGISCLRAAYKHWYIKSNLEKIDAIAHERQGLGIPFVKLTKAHTAEDVAKAENILSNMYAHHESFLVEPADISVEFKDMHAVSTKDAARAIGYHDRQIVKAVLAQFLDLGSGPTGSRALSEDHSELFLQSLEAIANNIADVINKYAIKQLVDLNFEAPGKYPKLEYTGISRTDVEKLSNAYQRFVQTGGIEPIEQDEQYLREVMGLPAKPEGTQSEDEQVDEIEEDLGLPEKPDKKKDQNSKEASELAESIDARLALLPSKAARMDFIEQKITAIKSLKKIPAHFTEVKDILSARYSELQRRTFQENNDFKGWRALTFAEKKVNFNSIQDFIDKNEAKLIDETRAVLKSAQDEYIKKLTDAVNSGDTAKIKELTLSYRAEYKSALKDSIRKSYEFGKANAAREMGVKTPPNPNDLMATIDVVADTITDNHFAEVVGEAKITLTDRLAKGESKIKALAAADLAIAKVTEALTRDTAQIVVAGYINTGRKTVFDKNSKKIYALQRSEILDSVTCAYCLSLDGRIVEQTDSIASFGQFHSNCRGIWVEIMKDEAELPKIEGVPSSLRDRLGDSVNELVQPKKAIVKKDSPAAKEANKRKDSSELLSTHPDVYGDCGGRPMIKN